MLKIDVLKALPHTPFPAIIWLIISTILFCLPGTSLPKSGWFEKLWVDKWVHLFLFAVLVYLWCYGFPKQFISRKPMNTYMGIVIACICYGIGIEFMQDRFIPNRSFDIGDILGDAAGAVLGLVIYYQRVIKK